MIKIICNNIAINKEFISYVKEEDKTKLLDLIEGVEGLSASIVFPKHYDYFTYHLMHDKDVLPYLYINNIVEWNIPFSQAYSRDFILTHNIKKEDGIYIETGMALAGGIGLPDIQTVWEIVSPYILKIISAGANVGGFISFITLIMQSWEKKKRMPTPHTFFEVILREKWNYHQLASLLNLEEEPHKAKELLKYLGYEWLASEQLYYLPLEKISKARNLLHIFDELKLEELVDKEKHKSYL